jgi:hypothetical protein
VLLFAVPPALFVALFLVATALRIVLTALIFLGIVVVPEDGSPFVINTSQSIREGVPEGNICVSGVNGGGASSPPTSSTGNSGAVRSTSSTGNTVAGRSMGISGAVSRSADSSSVVAMSSVWYVFAEAKDVMEGPAIEQQQPVWSRGLVKISLYARSLGKRVFVGIARPPQLLWVGLRHVVAGRACEQGTDWRKT